MKLPGVLPDVVLEEPVTGGRTEGAEQAADAAKGEVPEKTTGDVGMLCVAAAAGQGSARTAPAVVGLVAVPSTGGGVTIAAAVISGEPGSHALLVK